MRNSAKKSGRRQCGAEPNPPAPFQIVVGTNIQRLRKKQGLSVEQLAAECRMKTLKLKRLEAGEFNTQLKVLVRIARRLRVLPKVLLNGVR